MGVIAVFGGVRSTFTVTCARIMGIDGVFNSGKNLLRFKSQVGRVFLYPHVAFSAPFLQHCIGDRALQDRKFQPICCPV
jgi:hypothetical protein